MKKTIMNVVVALICTLNTINAWALVPGSYRGHVIVNDNKHGKANLMLLKIDDSVRTNAFIAVLEYQRSIYSKQQKVVPYLVDPVTDGERYIMTPLMVTDDGEIGVHNSNPSRVLELVGENIMITPSKSENAGLASDQQHTIAFTREVKRPDLIDAIEGTFRIVGKSRFSKIQLVKNDSSGSNGESVIVQFSMNSTSSVIASGFQVRQKYPGIFTLKDIAERDIGGQVAQKTNYLGVFVTSRNRPCKKSFLIIGNDGLLRAQAVKVRK
jgi:hypothetical protein